MKYKKQNFCHEKLDYPLNAESKLCKFPTDETGNGLSYKLTDKYVDKNVLICGLGISGLGAYNALKKLDANIFVCEKIYSTEKISNEDINFIDKLTPRIVQDMDLIILSPTTRLPQKIWDTIRENQIDCIGELEFGYRLCPAPIYAITGTNGKTTTTTLINEMIATSNNSYALGNIGKSFSEKALDLKPTDKVVLECSSFQLSQIKNFRPHIAVLLNLAPDHLDFHKNIDEYYNAKLKIFQNMNRTDFAVVNYDDNYCFERTKTITPQLYYFSTKQPCKGVFIQDDNIMFSDGIITYAVEKLENLRYVGLHNLSNILCAVCVAILAGISLENIALTLRNFHTPPHRLEFVRRLKNVDYYNDSKATNIESCLTACRAMTKFTHLLLGGSNKGENFKNLALHLPDNIKYIYLFGKTQKKLYKALKKCRDVQVFKCETLANATKFASLNAKSGEAVLLSPACASFDAFKNFEERGDVFKSIVNELQ